MKVPRVQRSTGLQPDTHKPQTFHTRQSISASSLNSHTHTHAEDSDFQEHTLHINTQKLWIIWNTCGAKAILFESPHPIIASCSVNCCTAPCLFIHASRLVPCLLGQGLCKNTRWGQKFRSAPSGAGTPYCPTCQLLARGRLITTAPSWKTVNTLTPLTHNTWSLRRATRSRVNLFETVIGYKELQERCHFTPSHNTSGDKIYRWCENVLFLLIEACFVRIGIMICD